MKSHRLAWLLVLAGVVIVGLVIWRETQLARWRQTGAPPRAAPRQLAPRFELNDQHRHVVKFERFLGRQRVLLIFCGASTKPLDDPRVRMAWECFERIHGAGIEVVAVGPDTATPFIIQAAEKEMGKTVPFPVLSDIVLRHPQRNPVHHLWGRAHPETGLPKSGVFLIARDGTVTVDAAGQPVPVADEPGLFSAICGGRTMW